MADLCRQCTKEIWGEDSSDLSTEGAGESYEVYALCESCGFVLVNGLGECIDPDCKLHRGQNAN